MPEIHERRDADLRRLLKDPNADTLEIPSWFIRDTLSLYIADNIALQRAILDAKQNQLVGWILPGADLFFRPDAVSYVTVQQSAVYVSQLAYLWGRLIIERNEVGRKPIQDGEYVEQRDNGNLVIGHYSLDCIKKIPLCEGEFPIKMWTRSLRQFGDHMHGVFEFEFHHERFQGCTTMVMPLAS